ncbi:uncharacterized protein [Aquarana catesbeiana]|uniref:uncharacterized protein n=1 Tax=Aquarana catesbeiana TaxID=8400 RepID=UPI003CCA5876
MLINTNMGSKDSGSICQSPAVHYNHFPMSPEIPAPPPPPPPIHTLSEPPGSPIPRLDPKRRLRSFNWEAIPMERVKGRSSLWSSETFHGDLQIDTGTMEELFGKHEEEIPPRTYNPRRSISGGDLPVNKVFLLDSRRSMNISILLRQFKRSAAQIVEDIRRGNVEGYSSERLTELTKHLPDRDEVERLRSFQGDRGKLSEADLFMLLLLNVPSYGLRLESLILKKDFHPAIVSQLSAARELKTAAEELLQCPELHFILKLVLKAGNFMNAGGYAGNAAGFRVSSLLKLADTKANKPGMNLLHFVVMEVQKKDPKYLHFADSLKHVQSASRLSEDNLLEDFDKLQSRVNAMQKNLAVHEEEELRRQMEEFLEDAEEQLHDVQKETDELRSWKRTLVDFLCEDEETFRMEECCKIFSCFCQKFQTAIKENKVRELEEQRRQQWERKRLQKRHSMATCGSLEAHQAVDELELTLERNLQNLCRTSSVRLCRMRSLGSHSPSPFVPQSEQRERIRGYYDQKNAEQMREMSERVLRQQMEYKSSRTLSPGHKANFYRVSKIPVNSYFQTVTKADIKVSPPKDRAEISPSSLEIKELEPRVGTLTQPVHGVNQQKPQHVSQLGDQYTPSLPDKSLSAHCVTKAEMETQTEILEPSGLSCQPFNYEGPAILGQTEPFLETAEPRQPLDMTPKWRKPLDGAEISRQSPLHLTCGQQSQTHPKIEPPSQMPLMSGSIILRQGLVTQCKCETIPEIASDRIEVTKYSLEENGHGTQRQLPQSKIPGFPPGFETLKPILTHSDSQNFTQFSMKSSPESGKKSVMQSNAQQGISMWNKQRDHLSSQISKKQPDKKKEVTEPQTLDPSAVDFLHLELLSLSAPETSWLSELDIRPDIYEQSLNSIITKNNELEAFIPSIPSPPSETLPGFVQEEQQRSSASSRTSNQHNLEHVKQTLDPILSTFPDQSETLPHTLIHLHPETLREDHSPRQSTLKLPKQYTVKSFKQTLVKASPKNSRRSVSPMSGPSLVQPRSDTCNPSPTPPKAELSRISQPKPGCYMSRIKQVDHLAVKQPAKDMNGQVAPPSHNVVEPSHVLQPQDMDYNYYAKGLKDASVQREALNPCSKWKRELRKASESAESKVESGNLDLNKDSAEQKTADHPKTPSLGRTGSSTSKKTKNDLGIKRVFTNKDVTLGSANSIVTKHPASTKPANTETRDSKIPQKTSAGPAKPPSTKTVGGVKERRESARSSQSDSSKSERRSSLPLASRPPAASAEGQGHPADHGKDPAWPSKKTNSVARVAVHVVKHYEVNSTLTRGARGPYLTTHPVWR